MLMKHLVLLKVRLEVVGYLVYQGTSTNTNNTLDEQKPNKSIIIPVLLYGAESWTRSTTEESTREKLYA